MIKLLKINYTPEGVAVSDFECEQKVMEWYAESSIIDVNMSVSTENVVYAARTLLSEGALDIDKVEFFFEGHRIGKVNTLGQLKNTPEGFCECTDNFLDRLIGLLKNNKKKG